MNCEWMDAACLMNGKHLFENLFYEPFFISNSTSTRTVTIKQRPNVMQSAKCNANRNVHENPAFFFNEATTNKRMNEWTTQIFMCILMILWIIRIAINFHTEVMRSSIIYALYMLIKSETGFLLVAHSFSFFQQIFKLVHDTHPLAISFGLWTHFHERCCRVCDIAFDSYIKLMSLGGRLVGRKVHAK